MLGQDENIIRQRRYLQGCLGLIILGSFPLYCIGFFLWGNAPYRDGTINTTQTAEPTFTPLGLDATATATPTDILVITATPLSPLLPTPPQFIPPATRFLSPTPPIVPPTLAPTLTFPPTNTPVPTLRPTDTPLPLPTNTFTPVFLPTDTPLPLPTNTPLPPPTNTPLPPPTDIPPDPPAGGGGNVPPAGDEGG